MRKHGSLLKRIFNSEDFFILPHLVAKANHLEKRDIKNIKKYINKKIGGIALVISIGMFVINAILLSISFSSSNGNMVDQYGLTALIGSLVTFGVCLISTVLSIIALAIEKRRYLLN